MPNVIDPQPLTMPTIPVLASNQPPSSLLVTRVPAAAWAREQELLLAKNSPLREEMVGTHRERRPSTGILSAIKAMAA
ncbi:uncharacterized protein ATNIH1004_002646 [Aspergillus tanneri]|uniref:Uncharacterized protein n=1 Tax=Aspergillus tanneri TaxID=1220188 RepID=A0A5M9MVL6_9EURO|nr:uncharacterized protein ATNIH1004_002646 [Aspergillus tanneri]KAA8649966.1 hypothetical protein ATNIH1004_002646 [Aspergillus tanneri]